MLRRVGHELAGRAEPVRDVTFVRLHTILLARLRFPDGDVPVVVKPFTSVALTDAAELADVNDRLRRTDPALGAALPGIHPGDGWVAQEFVPGTTLDRLLRQAALGRDDGRLDKALTAAAELMARVHAVPAERAGLRATPPAARTPDAERFAPLWDRLGAKDRYDFARLDVLTERSRRDFARRAGDRVLVVDSQPKNIIVADDGRTRCIDVDYAAGHPAIALAHFLVSLDRLALRSPRAGGLVRRWQRTFLEAYGRTGQDPAILGDLVLFYPWLLVRQAELHERRRPWLAPLLRRFYRRRLRDYCAALTTAGATVAPARVASLFDGAGEPSTSDSTSASSGARRAAQV